MTWKTILLPELTIFAVIAVFFLPACDLIYNCGCTHLWAGADTHCNIHNPAPPNCPFCSIPSSCAICQKAPIFFQMIPFAAMVVLSFTVVRLIKRKCTRNYFLQTAAGIVTAAAVMLIMAAVYALAFR